MLHLDVRPELAAVVTLGQPHPRLFGWNEYVRIDGGDGKSEVAVLFILPTDQWSKLSTIDIDDHPRSGFAVPAKMDRRLELCAMLEKPNHSHRLVHDLNFDSFAFEQHWQEALGASYNR